MEYYQSYWKAVQPSEKKSYPKGEGKCNFNAGIYYDRKDHYQGPRRVRTNSKKEKFWIYDYYFGWPLIDSETSGKIESNQDREKILRTMKSNQQ